MQKCLPALLQCHISCRTSTGSTTRKCLSQQSILLLANRLILQIYIYSSKTMLGIGKLKNHVSHIQYYLIFLLNFRCLSLGHPNVSPPVLSPQTRVSLGMSAFRTRQTSCSSQNELHSLDSEANLSPSHSLNILSTSSIDGSQVS